MLNGSDVADPIHPLQPDLDALASLDSTDPGWYLDNADWTIRALEKRAPSSIEVEKLSCFVSQHLAQIVEGARKALGTDPIAVQAFPPDEALAGYLDGLGQHTAAQSLREDSHDRYLRFGPKSPELIRVWTDREWLAFVLFPCIWRARRALLADTHSAPAVSLPVLCSVAAALLRKGRKVVDRPDGRVVMVGKSEVVARVDKEWAAIDLKQVEEALKATPTLAAHRLLRFLVDRGFKNAVVQKATDPRRIRVSGGFSGLASLLGMTNHKDPERLRAALGAFQHMELKLPHGDSHGLLTWTLKASSPAGPAELTIILGDVLLPHYVHGLGRATRSQQESRKLVPLPLDLPTLVGDRATHSAQALLQILVLIELRVHALEYFQSGGVQIGPARWAELGAEAGLRQDLLAAVLASWTGAPHPFLRRHAHVSNTYVLQDEHADRSISEAGKASRDGAERQRRSKKHATKSHKEN